MVEQVIVVGTDEDRAVEPYKLTFVLKGMSIRYHIKERTIAE